MTTQQLNREQRRRAAKAGSRKPARRVCPMAASMALDVLLAKHSTEDNDALVQDTLITPAHADLLALTGTATTSPWLDESGFIRLNEMVCFGFCLAKRIYEFGSDVIKEAISPSEQLFTTAAESLASVGERKLARGVWRANGDELRSVCDAFGALDELLKIADKGHTMTALIAAKDMIEEQLFNKGQVAGRH